MHNATFIGLDPCHAYLYKILNTDFTKSLTSSPIPSKSVTSFMDSHNQNPSFQRSAFEGKNCQVMTGNTCAVAICNSPKNITYHNFPRNGITCKSKIETKATYQESLYSSVLTIFAVVVIVIVDKHVTASNYGTLNLIFCCSKISTRTLRIMGRHGSTCAVAICDSPRNATYHSFPRNGIRDKKSLKKCKIEIKAKYQVQFSLTQEKKS